MKKIMVTKASMPSLKEYTEEIAPLWDSCILTNMGVKHNQFESELLDFLKADYLSLLTNGHMALELAIQAMELSGEVITTPFTFSSTTHAIVRNNLTPVFCDIREDDFTIDVERIEELITNNTSAILPVHVYGHPCDVEGIQKIADRHKLKVIYDAAHSFGVSYKQQPISKFGDASMFSFHATKVFNSIEGGAVVYHNPEFGKALYELKNFGIHSETSIESVGANAKMNEFQAAMGLCNLRHVREDIAMRKAVYEQYIDELSDVRGLKLTLPSGDTDYNYAYFPVVIEPLVFGFTRDMVYEYLKRNQIYARKYFYPLTNTFKCYENLFNMQETPVATHIAERVLTLPLYSNLGKDDVSVICQLLRTMQNKEA